MKADVLVIGAGLAGSTAARICAEQGKVVLVVERLNHIGGHCHDAQNDAGITVHTYGPHIFHTNKKRVWDFVNRFSPFRPYQHRVLSYVEGRLYPFPINLDTLNMMFGTCLGIDEMDVFLQGEIAKADYSEPPEHFRDAVVSQVGERLYKLFFKNYTEKQWQRPAEELAPDLAKRVPLRRSRENRYFQDPYQGIPVRGYTKLIESVLGHPNIRLLLNTDYFDIKNEINAELTVYTGELDRYFEYIHGKLEYRSLDFTFETLDSSLFQEVAVVNYPNDYDWTRITEYKHFTGEDVPKTTISYEYPKQEGEPYYVVPSKENLRKRENYMREVDKLQEKRNVLFIGRLAEYVYYNMDDVIESVFNRLL